MLTLSKLLTSPNALRLAAADPDPFPSVAALLGTVLDAFDLGAADEDDDDGSEPAMCRRSPLRDGGMPFLPVRGRPKADGCCCCDDDGNGNGDDDDDDDGTGGR